MAMALGMSIAMRMNSGAAMLGRRWCTAMRVVFAPSDSSASTYWFCFAARVIARTTRA